MEKISKDKLLQDKRVIDEIRRHLWIESEKAGKDISFDKACDQWFNNFADAWIQYYIPDAKLNKDE